MCYMYLQKINKCVHVHVTILFQASIVDRTFYRCPPYWRGDQGTGRIFELAVWVLISPTCSTCMKWQNPLPTDILMTNLSVFLYSLTQCMVNHAVPLHSVERATIEWAHNCTMGVKLSDVFEIIFTHSFFGLSRTSFVHLKP